MHRYQACVSISEVVKALVNCIATPPNYESPVRRLGDEDRCSVDFGDVSVAVKEMSEAFHERRLDGWNVAEHKVRLAGDEALYGV